jgi:hypothetical protein
MVIPRPLLVLTCALSPCGTHLPQCHLLAPMSFTYPHHVASFFDYRCTTLRPHQGFERDVANLFLRLQFTQPRRIRGIEKSRRRRNTHAADHSIGRGRRRHHGGHGSSNRWVEQSIHVQCFCLNALFQCFTTWVQLLLFNYFVQLLWFNYFGTTTLVQLLWFNPTFCSILLLSVMLGTRLDSF